MIIWWNKKQKDVEVDLDKRKKFDMRIELKSNKDFRTIVNILWKGLYSSQPGQGSNIKLSTRKIDLKSIGITFKKLKWLSTKC